MSIAKVRHERTYQDGSPMYIIKTPQVPFNEVTGNGVRRKLLGIWIDENGMGHTRHRSIAQRFDEEFHYEVTLPKGEKPWVNASKQRAVRGEELYEEPSALEDEADDYAE